MHEQEERKPSFLLSLVTFLGIACIIGYGLLGLGLDAHIPIAVTATARPRPRAMMPMFSTEW